MSNLTDGTYDTYDPLGFTKEVELLLNGLGCFDVTGFKKRNVCMDDLKDLTDDDLRTLGVGDKFDYNSFRRLCCNLKKRSNSVETPRITDIINILENIKKESDVLLVYLKYLNSELQNVSDFYIDRNKNIKFSEAVMLASAYVIQEINDFEEAIKSIELDEPNYRNKKIKYSLLFGGLAILVTLYNFY